MNSPPVRVFLLLQLVEGALEATRVRTLGLGQRLEPIGDFVKALFAGRTRHSRIHVGIFMGFAGDRRLEVVSGLADRQARSRIADAL